MKKATAPSTIAPRLFWLASAMFFLSGGTGLAYQVIWFKRFAHVWGSSSLAFASVGGSFLFGLGLGAWLIGRQADRIDRPLRWYGVCEVAIGIAALAVPYAIQWLIAASSGIYAYLPDEPLARYLLQFCITLLVVGPPCVLMGGTLPLLIRELTARDGAIDQATGWLYAINTFGAAAGCYLTGFQLLPTAGLLATNNMAAGLNIAIGLAALWFSRQAPQRTASANTIASASVEQPSAGQSSPLGMFGLYLGVALAGLAALILEMTWSRQLALVLGGSTYAYSATLFVVLLGIAAGSLLFHLGLRQHALDPRLTMAVVGGLIVTSFLGKLSLPWLSLRVGSSMETRVTLVGNAYVCVMASLVLEFLPSLGMGILFPLFVDLTRQQASRVGRTVGNVYAWNTFGSIIGASLTAVLLFPRIGTAGAMGVAAGCYLVALLLMLPWGTGPDRIRGLVSLVVGGVLVAGISLPQNPLRTNLGMYMYGTQDGLQPQITCPYFVEGASSSVSVVGFGSNMSLRVNGKVDAGDNVDMTTQLGLAYIPRLFRPDATDTLIIGFGSGTTLGTSLLFPEGRVTCCEIEPAVIGAAKYFSHINHRPLEKTRAYLIEANADLPPDKRLSDEQIDQQARLQLVFADGRGYLQSNEQQYDIISSEPSNPWLAGVSNLFTEEFFALAKSRLKPGGVLAQWVQTYHMTLTDYLMIVRSMRRVFPHCGLFTVSGGLDTVLLASDQPLIPDPAGLDRLQAFVDGSADVSMDLQRWFGTTNLRILTLSRYTIDEELLDQLIAKDSSQLVNTDLNLHLEFTAPLHLYGELPTALSARQRLTSLPRPRWTTQLASAIGISADSGEFQVARALQLMDQNHWEEAVPVLQKALEIDAQLAPAYRGLADCFLRLQKPDEALRILEKWVEQQPDRLDSRFALFNAYATANKHEQAVNVLRPAVEIEAKNAMLHSILGQALLQLNRNAEAVTELRRALELDPSLADMVKSLVWVNNYAWILATSPDDAVRDGAEALRWAQRITQPVNYDQWSVVDTLAAALAEVGQYDEAIKHMQEVLKRAQADGNKPVEDIARRRLKLYDAHQPMRDHGEPATKVALPTAPT